MGVPPMVFTTVPVVSGNSGFPETPGGGGRRAHTNKPTVWVFPVYVLAESSRTVSSTQNMRDATSWRRIGKAAALLAFLLLLTEHFLPHGIDLNPRDHWLSEYVLSGSTLARWLMRAAFLALAATAFSVGMTLPSRVPRGLFWIASLGLASMTFFDSDPNDGRSYRIFWPPTAGNLHQIALYLAIGATLAGMVFCWRLRGSRRSIIVQRSSLIVAACATVIQTILVAISQAHHAMTSYGGITERIVVLAMVIWVIASRESGKRLK